MQVHVLWQRYIFIKSCTFFKSTIRQTKDERAFRCISTEAEHPTTEVDCGIDSNVLLKCPNATVHPWAEVFFPLHSLWKSFFTVNPAACNWILDSNTRCIDCLFKSSIDNLNFILTLWCLYTRGLNSFNVNLVFNLKSLPIFIFTVMSSRLATTNLCFS